MIFGSGGHFTILFRKGEVFKENLTLFAKVYPLFSAVPILILSLRIEFTS